MEYVKIIFEYPIELDDGNELPLTQEQLKKIIEKSIQRIEEEFIRKLRFPDQTLYF